MKIEHIDEVKALAEARRALESERDAYYYSNNYYIQYYSYDEDRCEHRRFGGLEPQQDNPPDAEFFESVKRAIEAYFEAGLVKIERRLAELGVTT